MFNGISTSARYADLAEKYVTDKNYPVGTLIQIGGEAEATACENEHGICIGVIALNPSLFNEPEAEGQAVALVRRVSC